MAIPLLLDDHPPPDTPASMRFMVISTACAHSACTCGGGQGGQALNSLRIHRKVSWTKHNSASETMVFQKLLSPFTFRLQDICFFPSLPSPRWRRTRAIVVPSTRPVPVASELLTAVHGPELLFFRTFMDTLYCIYIYISRKPRVVQ